MARKKMLVVEDDKNTLKAIRFVLRQEGYSVYAALDGEAGFNKVEKVKPDVLICDIMMPKMDGMELLQKVKADPATKEMPVIMLTAKGKGKDIQKGYQYGADYYITKPFTNAQLLYGIRLMLK